MRDPLRERGFAISGDPCLRGYDHRRVFGRVMDMVPGKVVGFTLEINSRRPQAPLSLRDLDCLGAALLDGAVEILDEQ